MATLIFPEHPSPVADAEALKKACQGNPYLHDTFLFFSPLLLACLWGKDWIFFYFFRFKTPVFILFRMRVFSVLVKFFMRKSFRLGHEWEGYYISNCPQKLDSKEIDQAGLPGSVSGWSYQALWSRALRSFWGFYSQFFFSVTRKWISGPDFSVFSYLQLK